MEKAHQLRGKTALVVGASSGVGREVARQLATAGARVVAVARGAEALESLAKETDGIRAVPGDATDAVFAEKLVRDHSPDAIVLLAGVVPKMAAFHELDWDTFSEAWNNDVKLSFHVMRAALDLPLRPGSTVILGSSGAAINGSHLSGGYAGAKRMQWLMAGYAQKHCDAKGLGIRCIAFLPTQLVEGTRTAEIASTTYGASLGMSSRAYMDRFEVPIDASKVAVGIVSAIVGEVPAGVTAVTVSGKGVQPLP